MGSGFSNQNNKSHLPFLSLKMVLIGAPEAGKSSVFRRITANQFSHNYDETTSVRIGNIVKKINLPVDCAISIALWDLPGQEDVDIRASYFEGLDAAVMVVNIGDSDAMCQVPLVKADLLHLTTTTSDLASYHTEREEGEEGEESVAGSQHGTSAEVESVLKDIPVLVLGNKVDTLHIDSNQTELHPNVVKLQAASDGARCSGWVPVSAKDNDRSIDLAYTSFLRYLVERKLQLIKSDNSKVVGLEQYTTSQPLFLPPRTAATRVRVRTPEHEDEWSKKLPLSGEEALDVEYRCMRKAIVKVDRGANDWHIAYRRFRKATVEYNIVQSTVCSVEEVILNIKDRLLDPSALKIEKFQGWVKLAVDEALLDTDDVEDDVLEIIDCFNYDLVPNANYVAVSVREAQVTLIECVARIDAQPTLHNAQVLANTATIDKYLAMCDECVPAVQRLRTAIELSVMW